MIKKLSKPQRIRFFAWGSALMLLLAPYVAMKFTDEVKWSSSDFVIFGAMLFALGCGFELTAKMVHKPAHRKFIGAALLLTFFLVWLQLAVGI